MFPSDYRNVSRGFLLRRYYNSADGIVCPKKDQRPKEALDRYRREFHMAWREWDVYNYLLDLAESMQTTGDLIYASLYPLWYSILCNMNEELKIVFQW